VAAKKFTLKLPREPVSGLLGITSAHSNKEYPENEFPGYLIVLKKFQDPRGIHTAHLAQAPVALLGPDII
jgi:hypothetical protein